MKIKKRGRRADSVVKHGRRHRQDSETKLDAAAGVFFARELEYIKKQAYEKRYPRLMARQFIPASPDPAPAGAESVTWYSYDRKGMVKLISNYADDLPRIDIEGSQDSSPIKSLGGSVGWSWQEIKASMMAKKNLQARKIQALRKAMEEGIDEVLCFGSTDTGIPGFLNNANVPTGSVSGGTWATKAAADPDAIIDDIADMYADMIDVTKGVEVPDTLLIPTAQFALLALTRLVDQKVSVLQWLREALAPLGVTTIAAWWRLDGAGSGATDRIVLYRRDPEALYSEIPEEFELLDPQQHGLNFEVPATARIGGTIIPLPLSLSYRDGV